MKERGTLFSAPMVRELLADRKTQTRRIVKLPDQAEWHVAFHSPEVGMWPSFNAAPGQPGGCWYWLACPYGERGDRLWVRETWAHDAESIDDCRARLEDVHGTRGLFPVGPYYRADGTHESAGLRWIPSIHMPRWASRITLEVVSVRVERLQAITEEDARAEGVSPIVGGGGALYPSRDAARRDSTHREAFAVLWDSINGKRAPWDSDPFVWVVSFRRAADARSAT